MNRDRTVYLCIYVDDILCVSHTDDASRAFVSEMRKRFVVTDCGMPKVFLGIQLAYDRARRVLRMCQTDLIDTLLKRYNLTPTHVSTPLDPDVRLTCHDDADTKPDATIFRSKVGSAMYIQSCTRPDIAFAVKELSRFLSNPSHAHMRQADRLLHYLHLTRTIGQTYDASVGQELLSYSDADWAGQVDNRRSTSGRVHMLNGSALMWTSRQQRCVSLSTAAAEYVALSEAGRDVLWLRQLLGELGMPLANPTRLMEDNNSAIKWTEDSHAWSRSRHIDCSFHAIRQWCDDKIVKVEKVDTSAQLADLCTKALPTVQHAKLASLVLGCADLSGLSRQTIHTPAKSSLPKPKILLRKNPFGAEGQFPMTYSRRATPASTDFSFRSPFKSLPQHAQLWKNAERDELALLPRAARVAPAGA